METLSSAQKQSWLPWFLRGLLFLGLLLLFARVFDLQVIRGNYFKVLAEGNRIRRVPIIAARGVIKARGGEELVGNREVKKRVIFDPQEGFKKESVFDSSTSPDDIVTEWTRDYKIGEAIGHVTGYVGEVSEDELGRIKAECPEKGARKLGALVGRTGLEQAYDCMLTGIDGEELVEVDSSGNRVRTLGKKEPVSGLELNTHIHFGLQEKSAELLKGIKGAIVVSDGKGEVLSFISSPGFNPNTLVSGKNSDAISAIFNDTELPLFNRAMSGLFHPGSVFKPVVGIAALEEGAISPQFTYEDKGVITVNGFSYKNWYFTQYGSTEGAVDLKRALARSTDTFFYKIGEMVGPENIHKWSQNFGLDGKTGIDLPGEVGGLVPSPDWKLETKGERWYLGNTYHYAIGQGDLAVTPLAMNSAISAIANNGNLCTPRISGEPSCNKLPIKEENLKIIQEGMAAACATGGTGYTFFNFEEAAKKRDEGQKLAVQSSSDNGPVGVACKTGTAQTGTEDDTHAWFVAYAPYDNPEIVLTVLVEKGGEGSKVAGPIARSLMNYWFGIPDSLNSFTTPTPTPTSTE